MRVQSSAQGFFDFSRPASRKVVREYRAKYEAIDHILQANPQLTALAHREFEKHLSTSSRGRSSAYRSDQLLRALVVMFVEQCNYRQTVILIDNSEFLRNFVGLGVQPTMDYSFLCRAFSALSKATWQAMNNALAKYARENGKIQAERLRTDSTVYEINIHYPTDSYLLWDCFRTLARLVGKVQRELPELRLRHRFHIKKIKQLHTRITRNACSQSADKKRKVKSGYRALIQRVQWIERVGREVLQRAEEAGYEVAALAEVLPTVEKIVQQSEKRILKGGRVAATEKVYSLFEPHTELIIRGKGGKPKEFGHKVLIAQTGEKFIHHYSVLPQRREDVELLEPTLEAHRRLFDTLPDLLAADKGFYRSREQLADLQRRIPTVSIGKKGRRNAQETQRESEEEFQLGQRFRAGVEGSISVLKRVFNLAKCFFKGYKNYAASVGCSVFCHNLVLLTRL